MFFDIFFLHSRSSSTYILLQKFKKYTSEKHFSFQVLAHWNTYTHINNRIYRGFDVKKTLLVEFNWRSFSKKKFMWVQIGMMKCQFSKNLLVLTFLKVMCLIWVITCIFTEKLEEKKIIFFTLNRGDPSQKSSLWMGLGPITIHYYIQKEC